MSLARSLWAACLLLMGGVAEGQETQPTSDGAAHEAPVRSRDAAQAVQEGSVTQWLEHYQRERGEEWAKPKGGTSTTGSAAPSPSVPSGSAATSE